MMFFRHGADPNPNDGGIAPVMAALDKLNEYESSGYPYQLVSCLKLILRAIPSIEIPYKVRREWI